METWHSNYFLAMSRNISVKGGEPFLRAQQLAVYITDHLPPPLTPVLFMENGKRIHH